VSSGLEELSREELLALVTAQAQMIKQLQAQAVSLTARVAELERRLGRNSGNSSMPPSTDDLPGRTPPADKPASGGGKRKRGKQPGAPGMHLAWRPEPDETVPHFPQGACGCGADLADGADLGVARSHQQHEIPQMSAACTQHDLHAVRCVCGRVHVADRPDGLADTSVSYGPNLQSWCVYLMVVHAIPVQRCVQLVASLTGAAPSAGWVHGLLARTAEGLLAVDKLIRTLISAAYAVCCDETPIRVGARRAKKYLLVACTADYTWYHLGDRTLATFKDFGLADLTGVVVHDRYQNYDSAVFGDLVHQLCTAHILRDLADAAQCYPAAHWPIQIAEALRDLIHAANTARDAGHDAIDPALRVELTRRFRHGVALGLSEVDRNPDPKAKQSPGRSLLEVLRDRPDDVLRFAHDLRVPPTSNRLSGTCAQPRPSRRSPDGSPPKPSPEPATASAVTSPPPPSTAWTSSPSYATRSSAIPGCPPQQHPPDTQAIRPTPRHTDADSSVPYPMDTDVADAAASAASLTRQLPYPRSSSTRTSSNPTRTRRSAASSITSLGKDVVLANPNGVRYDVPTGGRPKSSTTRALDVPATITPNTSNATGSAKAAIINLASSSATHSTVTVRSRSTRSSQELNVYRVRQLVDLGGEIEPREQIVQIERPHPHHDPNPYPCLMPTAILPAIPSQRLLPRLGVAAGGCQVFGVTIWVG